MPALPGIASADRRARGQAPSPASVSPREPGFPAIPAALFLVLAAGIAVAGTLGYRSDAADFRRQAEAELDAVAALKTQQVRSWREDILLDAAAIEGNRFLARAVAPRPGEPGPTRAEIRTWLASLREHPDYAAVALVDASGRAVMALGPDAEATTAHARAEVAEALRSGLPVLSDVYLDGPGPAHLHLAAPLLLEGSAAPVGAVVVWIDPGARLFPLLRAWPAPRESGEILLVRRGGRAGAPAILTDPVGGGDRPPVQADHPIARAARGDQGVLEGVSGAGRPMLAAVRSVPDTPWSVVVGADAAAVLAPVRQRAIWVGLLVAAAVAAVGAGAGFWWRQQTARFYLRQWQAELERRVLAEHLDLVTRYANDVVLLLDSDLGIVEANDRAVATYGWPRDELLRLDLRALRAPEALAQIPDQFRRVREAGGHRFETAHRRRDGSVFPVEVSTRCFEVEGRTFFQAVVRDVTERKVAEAALRESEEKFRAVFLEAPIGVALVAPGGAIQAFNRAFQEMLGYDDQELRRTTMEALHHAADRRAAADGFARLASGALARLELEGRYLRRGGEVMHARVRASPVRDASGRHEFAVVMIEDVTEQRRAEEAARRSEERLQLALEATSDGIWDWDVARDEVYVSPRWLARLGYASGEIHDQAGMRALIHPEDFRRQQPAFEDHLRGRASAFRVEVRVRTKAGEWRWTENRARVAERDHDGRPLRVVGAFTDIDERKRMQARLMLAERLTTVGTLATGVAHEMNNPLAYVVVNLGFALEALAEVARGLAQGPHAPLLDEARRALEEARDGAERVRHIVSDLRTFAHPGDEARVPVDVRAVIQSSLNLAHNEIRHRARLVQDLAPVPPVLANAAELGQVFLNLLVNAAQAIPEGHAAENAVTVATRGGGEGLVAVEIRDTGAGIPADVVGRIFDPFFTTKKIGEGTGLGLAICHGIVTALGGEIQVESEPGRGSVFRVLLPIGEAAAPSPPRESAPAAFPRRGRILVVDDEPRLGKSIERLLVPEHDVTAVTSAREALARITAGERYDVILCDLMMPEMTGMDLHEALSRSAPRLAERMVFMTGGAFTGRARDFLERSAHRRLEKPFRPDALQALIGEMVGADPPEPVAPAAGPGPTRRGAARSG